MRELKHAAQRFAAIARSGRVARSDDVPGFEEHVDAALPSEPSAPIDDERLVSVLREHRFQLSRTAEALGISRTHLDVLIAKSSRLRKAKDIDRAEIEASAAAHGGDIDAMAAALEVSPRGLKLRMRQLGL